MKNAYLIAVLLAFVVAGAALGQTEHSARAQGLGGAFSAISDDPSALSWNPAGLTLFRENSFVSHFTIMFGGFCPDNLGTGSAGYVHHFPGLLSAGISADMLYSDIYSRNIIGLTLAKEYNSKLTFGLRTNFFLSGYNSANFVYASDDNPEDPVFDNGYNTSSFGLDLGAIAKPIRNLSVGLYCKNLLSPNLAFSDTLSSKYPLEARLGAAYTLYDNYTLSAEVEYLSEKLDDNNIKYFFGAETWQLKKTVALRAGYNPDWLSFSVGYRNPSLAYLGFDYTFAYPLSEDNMIAGEGAFSHKATLTLGFRHIEKVEPEPEPVETVAAPVIPPEPEAEVVVTPAQLSIAEVTQIYEEEPLVPAIFFSAGSYEVDRRFDPLIETIGERLVNNPDIRLGIYGYYDARSDGDNSALAMQRAKAVEKRFIELVPEARKRITVVESGYDPDHRRAGIGREAPSEKQQQMINQENRRTEFKVDIAVPGIEGYTMSASTPSEVAAVFGPILSGNPDIDLIIEGGGSTDELSKAFEYKDKLTAQLSEEDKERVFVSLSGEGEREVKLNADGVIYRPRKVRSTLEFSDIGRPSDVAVEANAPGGFASYSIDIIDLEGTVFRTLKSGTGLPPEQLQWDWRDADGNLVDTRGKYLARFTGIDTLGRTVTDVSEDTFMVKITKREVVRSKLLIVQFVYDEDVAQAAYLEDRLEYVTRRLLNFAQETDKTLKVKITGHTDILGTERRNIELSQERAEAEYENISLYLRAILGLPNKDALDKWFSQRNVDLTFEGQGPFEPYAVTRWVEGDKTEHTIGDNALPEGRTINRRVVIEMELIKEGQ